MALLARIKNFIQRLDDRQFYIYLGVFLGIIFLLMCGYIYYYYKTTNYLKKQMRTTNELRERVRDIIDKDEIVLKQRAEVNTMLAEVPDFKIDGYFTELRNRLGLEQYKRSSATTYADRGDPEYLEVLLNVKFDGLNMRQLTELLDAIEQNKRVYTKDLEIVKSKKAPNAIDVTITIATLQKKTERTEVE